MKVTGLGTLGYQIFTEDDGILITGAVVNGGASGPRSTMKFSSADL